MIESQSHHRTNRVNRTSLVNDARVLATAVCTLAATLLSAGCASGPSVWERAFVPDDAPGGPAPLAKDAPINIRSAPMERVDAAMQALDAEVASSDVPRTEWPADKAARAQADLLRALQVTTPPDQVRVLGVSRFRSTDVLRPGTSDARSLSEFARTIGATTAVWSTRYLGKTDTVVEKPVTTFSSSHGGYWGRGRHWRDDHCWPELWGSSTTWVPVRVQADEYLYVVFFLNP